jgi:DNA-binding MarR family transcriptional regulator
VARHADPQDGRRVLVSLTTHGAEVLVQLSRQHRAELRQSGPELLEAVQHLLGGLGPANPDPGEPPTAYAPTVTP